MNDFCGKFIFASAFAYFAGVLLVLLGYPPVLNQSPLTQLIAFLLMGLLSVSAINPNEAIPQQENLRTLLAMVWGAMAAFTFVGYVRWAPDGSAPYQLFMTAWDLLLAVAVLED